MQEARGAPTSPRRARARGRAASKRAVVGGHAHDHAGASGSGAPARAASPRAARRDTAAPRQRRIGRQRHGLGARSATTTTKRSVPSDRAAALLVSVPYMSGTNSSTRAPRRLRFSRALRATNGSNVQYIVSTPERAAALALVLLQRVAECACPAPPRAHREHVGPVHEPAAAHAGDAEHETSEGASGANAPAATPPIFCATRRIAPGHALGEALAPGLLLEAAPRRRARPARTAHAGRLHPAARGTRSSAMREWYDARARRTRATYRRRRVESALHLAEVPP